MTDELEPTGEDSQAEDAPAAVPPPPVIRRGPGRPRLNREPVPIDEKYLLAQQAWRDAAAQRREAIPEAERRAREAIQDIKEKLAQYVLEWDIHVSNLRDAYKLKR